MSYKKRTRRTPSYVQKISLDTLDGNSNNRKIRKRPKLCPDCKEANDCVKLLSSKVIRIEEIINDLNKNLQKKNTTEYPKFNAKFMLNNVPCELEYDLSNFSLENLQKLVTFTTPNCNNDRSSNFNNKNPSTISTDEDSD